MQIMDILEAYKVNATFFLVGFWVDKYPESVKALSDAGHEIMNHSDDHAHFTKLSKEQIQANISQSGGVVEPSSTIINSNSP